MSELGEKRRLFTRLLPILIDHMLSEGYEPMIGKDGLKHMPHSLHYEGLAVDIDLTKDGKYLADTESHRQFGEIWEGLDPDCRWGGRFGAKDGKLGNDGNHYSVTYQGRS